MQTKRKMQANSGYELASKPKIKKKDIWCKRTERKQQQETNTFWKERGSRKCQRATWQRLWIHVICVHNTTHLEVTTTLQGSRHSRTTPHQERLSSLFKHKTTTLIPTLQMNAISQETKGQAKRKNSQWQEPVTSPNPNSNPGRPWNC